MNTSERTWAYAFENGDGRNKMLLGGKGANLCEMTRIGLNVPPGFVITTAACLAYLDDSQRRLPDGVMEEVRAHMRALEQKTGKRFGGGDDPLLVSVRSGSAMSMPGMMDTILNLGLNETTLAALIRRTGNERFGYDAVCLHTDLTRKQNVLASLRHRTVNGRHNQDRAVHLGGTRDHVLDVVSVTGAVDVCVVPRLGLVLDVRDRDGDAALTLLRSLVDHVEWGERVHVGVLVVQHLGDRRGKSRLTVVDVPDGADVDVRLGPLELGLRHWVPPQDCGPAW